MTGIEFNPIVLNAGLAENISCWNYRDVEGPFARLYYVPNGQNEVVGRIEMGDRSCLMRPGKMYLIPPFARHNELSDCPFSHIYLHIYDRCAGESIFDRFDFPLECDAGPEEERMFLQLLADNPGRQLGQYEPASYSGEDTINGALLSSDSDSFCLQMRSAGLIYGIVSEFMASAQVKRNIRDSRVSRSLVYIAEHLSNVNLSVPELASVASLSENQFIRRFKAQTGMTPLRYITGRRIEKSQILLMDAETSVKNVSLSVGFSDSAYFCRVFRKMVGKTPLQYKSKYIQ